MASDAQPDNITDGPDIQRLRSIRLDEDPGLMWPHQMRFEVRIFFFSSPERNDPPRVQEVKRRIGRQNYRVDCDVAPKPVLVLDATSGKVVLLLLVIAGAGTRQPVKHLSSSGK
ncbi:hypothetical protein BDZ89DRAFT_1149501 [Hymenopellis radicata]|nr:hypothetical protein BDZ89DRAFT_1149501 [Hymenopellis radicata]